MTAWDGLKNKSRIGNGAYALFFSFEFFCCTRVLGLATCLSIIYACTARPIQTMSSVAVDHFIRFCINANIDHRQMKDSLRKYLVAYQRNIIHRGAFTALFGESFINWDYVERALPRMECVHWIAIFKLIDFTSVSLGSNSLLNNIQQILESQLNIREDGMACQLFLLKNMNFITSQSGVERLFCESEIPDAYNKTLRFFALSADAAFDLKETTAVFCHIMKQCAVNEVELERQIQFVNLREEELTNSFKVKQIRVVGGRPRLRARLTAIRNESGSAVIKKDDFESWGRTIGFPSVFSLNVKYRLYFLMSQVCIPEPMEYVPSITRDGYVCAALLNCLVKTPEVGIIHKVIVSMRLLDEPFRELHDFRCECLNAFPVMQLKEMLLNDLLHMYVCAYQNPLIWKDVWKLIIPLLSHQVIRDVETFVQRRPFNYSVVLSIMNNS